MKILGLRTGAWLASAAALSMVATPALANHGWGGGYGGGGGWGHRDRGDDTGAWVVGGIIGIGMIAAIASAASKGKRDREARNPDRDYRERDYRDNDYRSRDYRDDRYRSEDSRYGNRSEDSARQSYSGSSRSLDGAVDSCVGEVERGSTRVDTVDSVDRDGTGWRVTGRLTGGRSFDCAVEANGRIRSATVDGRAVI